MFYVIQTNTSLNGDNAPMDFQSMMYRVDNQDWDAFKQYILDNENYTKSEIQGTMHGLIKSQVYKVDKVLINDDIHLEVIMSRDIDNMKVNTKYYMVAEEKFSNLLSAKTQ